MERAKVWKASRAEGPSGVQPVRARERRRQQSRVAEDAGFGALVRSERQAHLPVGAEADAEEEPSSLEGLNKSAPSGVPWPAVAPRRTERPAAVAVHVPGVIDARILGGERGGKLVEVQLHDATLATQGLVHGLSEMGWRVDVRRSSPREHSHSRDRRKRENRGQSRERMERADV